MQPDIHEALRYLGVRGKPDTELLAQMTALTGELSSRITPRFIWRVFPLQRAETLQMGGISLPGKSAERMLQDCQQAILLICTLGITFDQWLRQLQARDMAQAVMLDALGSAYVEAACDAAEAEIAARFPEKHLTDRFSPGYGDLPLTVQPALLAAGEGRRIGVSCTESLLMAPQKSVTALIGLADRPQMARIRGCAYCSLSHTCNLRKAGTPCHV